MRTVTSYNLATTLLFAFAVAACKDSTPTAATPADPLIGRYALTVTAGPACTALPEVARSRTYGASIDWSPALNYVVTLSGATFMADQQIAERGWQIHCGKAYGLDCNQFTAGRDSDGLRLFLVPNYQRLDNEFAGMGGSIAELVPPNNSQLTIEGTGLGQLDGAVIQAAIDGRVYYCPAVFRTTEECAICDPASMTLTFTRR